MTSLAASPPQCKTCIWVPLFIQCVLTLNIKMSPGSLLDGAVEDLGDGGEGKALPYCLFIALPSQCVIFGVES